MGHHFVPIEITKGENDQNSILREIISVKILIYERK